MKEATLNRKGEARPTSFMAAVNCVRCGVSLQFGWSSVSQEAAEQDAARRRGRSCGKCVRAMTTVAGPYSVVIDQGGINWSWYLALEVDPEREACRVLYHDRFHRFDTDQRPAFIPRGMNSASHEAGIREGEGRVAEAVSLTLPDGRDVELRVTNPENTFAYTFDRWYREVREQQAEGLL